MRVLVCGGRDYTGKDAVSRKLDEIAQVDDEHRLGALALTIIHGRCPTGADRWAADWAAANWAEELAFPADWAKHGRAAGPIRNQRMVDEGKPDLVVAFPGGRGTADMVRRAKAAGVEVREIAA